MNVLDIRPETREVVVGSREDLFRDRVSVSELNWLGTPPSPSDRIRVQLRYHAPVVEAIVVKMGDRLVIDLDEAQPAVTPGQSAVVFDGDRVLGGGRILSATIGSATIGASC